MINACAAHDRRRRVELPAVLLQATAPYLWQQHCQAK